MIRVIHCITILNTKATATETNIPSIIVIALSVLMSSDIPTLQFPLLILKREMAKEAPMSSKTSDTEVEVGRPSRLKMSNSSRLEMMTEMKM